MHNHILKKKKHKVKTTKKKIHIYEQKKNI